MRIISKINLHYVAQEQNSRKRKAPVIITPEITDKEVKVVTDTPAENEFAHDFMPKISCIQVEDDSDKLSADDVDIVDEAEQTDVTIKTPEKEPESAKGKKEEAASIAINGAQDLASSANQ